MSKDEKNLELLYSQSDSGQEQPDENYSLKKNNTKDEQDEQEEEEDKQKLQEEDQEEPENQQNDNKNIMHNQKNTLPNLNSSNNTEKLKIDLDMLRNEVKNRRTKNKLGLTKIQEEEQAFQQQRIRQQPQQQEQEDNSTDKNVSNKFNTNVFKNFISSVKSKYFSNKKNNMQQQEEVEKMQQYKDKKTTFLQNVLFYGLIILVFLIVVYIFYSISYSLIFWIVSFGSRAKNNTPPSQIVYNNKENINNNDGQFLELLNANREKQVKEYITYLMKHWLDQKLSPLDLNEVQSNCYMLLSKTQYFEKLIEPLLELIKLDVCSAKNKNLMSYKASVWFTDIANKKIEQLLELVELE